ncbi:MAG: hypothetical protein K0Q59_5806 [Paenibacillus sp.]|nr:hypothetical protein [Paenibacillus sp.]
MLWLRWIWAAVLLISNRMDESGKNPFGDEKTAKVKVGYGYRRLAVVGGTVVLHSSDFAGLMRKIKHRY